MKWSNREKALKKSMQPKPFGRWIATDGTGASAVFDAEMVMRFVNTWKRHEGVRKVEMIPEFDQYPYFHFTNHSSIQGCGSLDLYADHFQKLDFELESSLIVICRKGRSIHAEGSWLITLADTWSWAQLEGACAARWGKWLNLSLPKEKILLQLRLVPCL